MLEGRAVLLVGGGAAAFAKFGLLRQAGAQVTVVAPSLDAGFDAALTQKQVTWRRRGFVPDDIEPHCLVIAATGIEAVDAAVARAADAAGRPVNVVDRPALCSFIVPAIVDRSPVTIAISSGGTAPVLVQKLRSQIEALLPSGIGGLAAVAGRFRGLVKAAVPARRRPAFWRQFFTSAWRHSLNHGSAKHTSAELMGLLKSFRGDHAGDINAVGRVALVGAGPGDPDLLTLKALQALADADVIVHDRLVAPAILERARRDAALIDVGKAKGRHSRSQTEINALLAHLAEQGKTVIRLKGGDPFIFGRGGEEMIYLRSRGIEVEIIPGVTAASACAAAAGVPLTHRAFAHSVTFLTGHGSFDSEAPEIEAPDHLAGHSTTQTLAIYMAVTKARHISQRLIAAGWANTTPVAVIENGTRPNQRVLTGRLRDLGPLVNDAAVEAPALLIVGEVAAMALDNSLTADRPLRLAG